MAKSKKMSKKELNQPDQFLTTGEQILENLVQNRNKYMAYVGGVLLLLLLIFGIRTYFQHQNDEISGKYAKALEILDSPIVQKDSENKPEGLYYETEQAKYLAASQAFETIAANHAGTNFGMASQFYAANSLFLLKRHTKAREKYELFLAKAGSGFDNLRFIAQSNIAQCYDAEGKMADAVKAYRQILDADSDAFKDQATYQLAMLNLRMDKKDEAIKWFEKVGTDFPESTLKAKADKRLNILRGPVKEEEKAKDKPAEAPKEK